MLGFDSEYSSGYQKAKYLKHSIEKHSIERLI